MPAFPDYSMKYTGILWLLIFFTRTSAQDYTPLSYTIPDLSFYNLKGTVAEVRLQTSVSVGTDMTLPGTLEAAGIDSFKELILKFDSTGKLWYKKEMATTAKKEETTEYFYNYLHNLPVSRIIRKNNKVTDSITYDYDRRKRISSYLAYDGRGRISYKYTFTYNSRQQLITIRRKNEENFPVEMIKIKYDEEGRLSEQQFFDDNMKKMKVIDFNSHRDDSTGFYNRTILTYNDTGQLVSGIMTVNTAAELMLEQSIVDGNKKVTDYRTYRYTGQNNIEEEKIFADMENTVIIYKYKYDEYGNWIEKVAMVNDNPAIITSRNIIYFK